jgi:RNA polymerase sigma factor (sigma-70 family)
MSHQAIRDYLRQAVGADPSGTADTELLARFAQSRDETAFELVVWRHAALVQRVCRAVLRDHHAAEDAAQAAFLTLARKAHTFSGRGSVVGWLYRVARRIAVRLAKDRARRAATSAGLERVPDSIPVPDAAPDEVAALCAEVDRLPQRYRIPILLCFFEGLTHAEAARRTGWPVGSVAGRLARAKDLLARRLARRGVGVAGVVLGVPAGSFVGSTAQAAPAFAARNAVVPGVEPSTVKLAEGAMQTMTATTWKLIAASATAVFAAAGVWGYSGQEPQAAQPQRALALEVQPAAPAQPAARHPNASPAQRAKSMNNLKQILLALHNYHDVNGNMPHDITDKDGKPILSWRVAILPYLDQDNLFKQFRLDEPWDSDHNKKLLALMPSTYRTPGIEPKDSIKTHYQGFVGPDTMFEPGKKIKMQDIQDGTSNTIAVVEAGPPVEWSKPADIPYDPKKPLTKLEGPFANVMLAAHGDGAARAYPRDVPEKTMRLLIERGDGQVIPDLDKLRPKFPLTKEEAKTAEEFIKRNEKLIEEIAQELREQHKILVEQFKKLDPKDPTKGVDLETIGERYRELEGALEHLKRQTEEMRKGPAPIVPQPPPPVPTLKVPPKPKS